MKTLLNFQEYLIEMFDNPWDLEDISDTTLGKIIHYSAKTQSNASRIKSIQS